MGAFDGFGGLFHAMIFVYDHSDRMRAAGLAGANFLLGLRQAAADGGLIIAGAFAQAAFQILDAGRQDENAHGVRK